MPRKSFWVRLREAISDPDPWKSASDMLPVKQQILQPEHDNTLRNWNGSRSTLLLAITVGIAVVVLYGLQHKEPRAALAMAAIALTVAGASLFVGGLIGFLFGIPLSSDQTKAPDESSREPETAPANPALPQLERRVPRSTGSRYRPNTNLEQISDWLTKILVGVGLVEFENIRDGIVRMAGAVDAGLGPDQDLVFAMGILIYFFVCGFFLSYLWTRLHLPTLLSDSEREAARLEGMREGKELGAQDLAVTIWGPSRAGYTKLPSAANVKGPKRVALWVDDRPSNNDIERHMLENVLDISLETSTSTQDALAKLDQDKNKYLFVISDMARPEGAQAGYDLLTQMRKKGMSHPFIIYAGGGDQWDADARKKGALGSAGSMERLVKLARDAVGSLDALQQ